MFINCPYCSALVATDPSTDLPPERCPRCAGVLRGPATTVAPAPATPVIATPTISSLLVPPAASGRPVTPDVPATTPVADVVEDAIEAIPDPAAVAATAAEKSDVAPAPPPSIELAAVQTIDVPDVTADAGGTDPPVPVDTPSLSEDADAAHALTPAHDDRDPEPDGTASDANATSEASPTAANSEPAPAPGDTRSADDPDAPPNFLPARARTSNAAASRRWLAPAIITALALLLGLQVLLADRARLAADARWRPWVLSLCNVFGCDIPAWREPAAFTLLAREVRPHPQAADALRVDATFRNDARWPQAWPRLLLTLSDLDGRPVAARAFEPTEYLAEPAHAATLDSGASARIRIELREPAAATVSYSFDFR